MTSVGAEEMREPDVEEVMEVEPVSNPESSADTHGGSTKDFEDEDVGVEALEEGVDRVEAEPKAKAKPAREYWVDHFR
ncbi:hypothetical protein KIPB_013890, partial [Kipferlia bialata]|eukprot:g13890.t1